MYIDWEAIEERLLSSIAIVKQRQNSYNTPDKNFDDIAKVWSVIFKTQITAEQTSLAMIALKILRENFSPSQDNLDDIIGYTICLIIIDQLKKQKRQLSLTPFIK